MKKPENEFNRNSTRKDGLQSYCRSCSAIVTKEWQCANKDKVCAKAERYREQYPERILVTRRTSYLKLREKCLSRTQKWREKNTDLVREQRRNWIRHHPHYTHESEQRNVNYKLGRRLRTRLYHALHGQCRHGSAITDLGCSVAELKQYLAAKFQPGMTWENYGKVWHIDHIIPLSFFDLQNETEFKMAVRYQNLQPLFVKENLMKHASLSPSGCLYPTPTLAV